MILSRFVIFLISKHKKYEHLLRDSFGNLKLSSDLLYICSTFAGPKSLIKDGGKSSS
jgi:hypothetical protein